MQKIIIVTIGYYFFLVNPIIYAQTIVRGVVSDYQTGQPLEAATVMLQNLSNEIIIGTTTDENGFYQLNNITIGKYIFSVRYLGFRTLIDTLEITGADQNLVRHARLVLKKEKIDDLTVLDSEITDLKPGQTNIRPEDLKIAPTPAGSADLMSYIQTQPGVVATGDRGGQLFVRGGTPSENLVLVDGTQIYQPFHIIGFFSVFPEEVVSNADFYAGGFGAEYNSRTSAVLDVRLRNGNLYEQNYSASVSPFISDFFYERPIKKGKSSILLSIRRSMIEESSKIYLSEEQPLRFNSQLIKFSAFDDDGLNCSAHFIRTYDRGRLDFTGQNYFKWNNTVLGSRCAGVSEESSVSFIEFNFGLSHFKNEAGNAGTTGRHSSIFKSNIDFTASYYLKSILIEYGLFGNYNTVTHDVSNLFQSIQEGETTFMSTGGFISSSIPIGDKISIDTGVSFTTFLGKFNGSIEPRFQFSWQPGSDEAQNLQFALGIYRQPILGVSDYRDAGTAFTAWLPTPEKDRMMENRHILLGWHQPINSNINISIEGYNKKIFDTPIPTWSTTAQNSTDLSFADGIVNGLDAKLNINYKSFYVGMGYGYTVTEYETTQDNFEVWFGEPTQTYNPSHDRRHQVNVQVGLNISNFNVNIAWLYGSGFPFTRPIGFDSFFSFENTLPNVTNEYGEPRVLLDKPFQGRMPDVHRLDISVERLIEIFTIKLKVQGGAINMYNRENLFYYDVFNQKGIDQLPLLPYISLKIESL